MLRDPVSPSLSQVRAALILAAIFLGVMALFFNYHDPYRDVGGDILVVGDLERAPFAKRETNPKGPWKASGASISWEPQGGFGSGVIRLATSQGHESSLRYALENPHRFQFLRVTGRLRSEGIVVGEQGWNTARLLLFFTDRDGRPHWEYPHGVCTTTGTQSWQYCMRVISVPDFAVVAHLVVQNAAASGTLWVDDLQLTPAVEKASAFVWRTLFATAWCGILAYCVWTARLARQKLGLPIFAIGILIIAGVGAPEPALEQLVNRGAQAATGLVNGYFSNPGAPPTRAALRWPYAHAAEVGGALQYSSLSSEGITAVKKLGHFVLFGVLAFLASSSATRRRPSEARARLPVAAFATIAVALLLFAAATEIVQFLTGTRTPSLYDWAINAGGILLGASTALVMHLVAPDRVRSAPSPDIRA